MPPAAKHRNPESCGFSPTQPRRLPCAWAAASLEVEVCLQPHCASGRSESPVLCREGLQAAARPAPVFSPGCPAGQSFGQGVAVTAG